MWKKFKRRAVLGTIMAYRVTLVRIRKTQGGNLNQELQWLGNSLGLFNLRDRDSSCFRVFITLVRAANQDKPLTSDEIAERLHLSRGTVVHHLHRLIESGIVIKEKEGYLLRESSIEKMVRDIRQDMETMFSELTDAARQIDENLR